MIIKNQYIHQVTLKIKIHSLKQKIEILKFYLKQNFLNKILKKKINKNKFKIKNGYKQDLNKKIFCFKKINNKIHN